MGLGLLALLLGARGVGAEEPAAPQPADVARLLRRSVRSDLNVDERVAAADEALKQAGKVKPADLAAPPPGLDADAWLRAATRLLADGKIRPALPLVVEAPRWGSPRREAVAGVANEVERISQVRILHKPRKPWWWPDARHLMAIGMLVGWAADGWYERGSGAGSPVEPVVRVALEQVLGPVLAGGDEAAIDAAIERSGPVLDALTQAGSTDGAEATKGLESVLAQPDVALPLLMSRATALAKGVPPGLLAQGQDILALLGQMGRREATPVLVACLEAPQGWVRYGAACALGDLGDPAAAVALARQIAYAGDLFRSRESWDYPGTSETPIPPEAWDSVEYYVIDVAAADALLKMGARGAAGWLVRNTLNPARRNLRIRVPQDAIDVLRRHLPKAPLPDLLVDGSLPDRFKAWEALEAWWRAHRDEPGLLARTFPRDDPGFVAVADRLALRLTEPKVLELMIAKDSCELLSESITPALTKAAATAKPGARTELARALARTRDPAAAQPLLAMLAAPQGFVRAAAAEVLDVYARHDANVVAALLQALDDPDCGVRIGAMKGLVGAPVRADVLAAAQAHTEAAHVERCGADAGFGWARAAVLLVQEGEGHASPLLDGLVHTDRVVRRTAWDLLRAALDLPEHLVDPMPPPDSRSARPLDPAVLSAAWKARRQP